MTPMQLIASPRHASRTALIPLVPGTLVGALLIVGGLALAYIAFGTPLLTSALPKGRPDAIQMAGGMATWAVALVAPAGFVLLGTSRLARILAMLRRRDPVRAAALRALNGLPADMTLATGLTLPDGRGVSNLVIGPFGVAVVRELPPAAVTRVHDGRWELRTARGWVSLENPLERAARDAERVRRWIADDDADFVVKAYAAVVGPDASVPRTPACAVLTPDLLGTWLGGLPPQRSLTENRRERMLEIVRRAAG